MTFKRCVDYCDSDSIPETKEQRARRWTSIRIVYLTMFFDSLSFSLVLASLWPYLQKVNKGEELNPIYVGIAGVSFHVCGILVDFVMGLWTNRRGSMEPLLVSLFVFACGNLLYGYAEACGSHGVAIIIVSRGIIGLSTGVNVIARSALSDSTTLKERTGALAHMSLAEGVGFAFGPAVQLLSIPLGDKGVYLPLLKLNINLYTAPAFISTFVAMINALLIIGYYYEYHINIYKDSDDDQDIASFRQLLEHDGESLTSIGFDKLAVVITLVLYFVAQSSFALYETILPPLTMDMLAWSRRETALYASVLFVSAGVIAIFAFALSALIEKRWNDKVILFSGFGLIFLGFAIHLPWGSGYPDLKRTFNSTQSGSTEDLTGCPEDYDWCKTSPKMFIPQIILGTVFLSIGYPFVMVFTSSMYSKILGPSPQGIMQSLYGAVGGLARIVAPMIVTYLYVDLGPRWTFISVDSLVLLSIVLFMVFCKRLIPYHLFILNKNKMKCLTMSDVTDISDDGSVGNPKETKTVALMDDLPDVKTNTRVVLRIEQYVTRANRWSLIDRSSYYSNDTII